LAGHPDCLFCAGMKQGFVSSGVKSIVALSLLVFSCITLKAQQAGCTDPLANNYNAAATVNDGSCTYNSVRYTPPSKVNPLSDSLQETSGLVWAANALWTINDGGNAAILFKIDTVSRTVLQKVLIPAATNTDWEDIAFDGFHFYIGDFGNNVNGARTDLRIYKIPLAAIPDHAVQPVFSLPDSVLGIIRFTYADQPQPPQPVATNSTAFDCEALVVTADTIHLFSKNWLAQSTTHYVINSVQLGDYVATPVETLPVGFLVTAASLSVGNNVLALLGYQASGSGSHFMYLLSGYSNGRFFNGNKRRIDLPDALAMGQAEGLCFKNAFTGYISNEKLSVNVGGVPITVRQRLRYFDMRQWVSGMRQSFIFWGNGAWATTSNWTDAALPPLMPNRPGQVIVDPLPGGACNVTTPVALAAGMPLLLKAGKQMRVGQQLRWQ